ncbi:hypothetical protein [Streptomyces sp. TN58]|uniref:hypothetical protein n=1 Tax=Streptomyces sp. TN58 TaxID=234612 RepID=UPI001331B4DD|nr:hypothetical protein [Streptomyces sp. TN58]
MTNPITMPLAAATAARRVPASRLAVMVSSSGVSRATVKSARKVGLIQTGTVKSSASGVPLRQTYVFSPLVQTADDPSSTAEALHLRKLFTLAFSSGVRRPCWAGAGSMIRWCSFRSSSMPAPSALPPISALTVTFWKPLASCRLTNSPTVGPEEIVRDGLDWLKASVGSMPGGSSSLKVENAPGLFVTPEEDRSKLTDDAASDEITTSAILELRKEVQRAVRHESPFGRQ